MPSFRWLLAFKLSLFPLSPINFLFFLFPTIAELSLDNEIEGKSEFYELPQEWPEESLPDEHDSKESWEEEVDNLVTWSNGLDEDSLNYETYESGENYENFGN